MKFFSFIPQFLIAFVILKLLLLIPIIYDITLKGQQPSLGNYQSKFSSVQLLSRVQLFVTPWAAECQASLPITNSWSLLKFMPIKSVMPSKHLILCHPLLLLPSIFPSIRVFPMSQFFASGDQIVAASGSAISPSNEYSGLLSFRIDWFDLPAVQGTLKSLL